MENKSVPNPLPAPSTIIANAVVSHDRPVGIDRSIPHQPVFNHIQNIKLVGMPEKDGAGIVAARNIEEARTIFSTRATLCHTPGIFLVDLHSRTPWTKSERDLANAMHCIAEAMKSYEQGAPPDHALRPFVPRRPIMDILNLLKMEAGDGVSCVKHGDHSAFTADPSEHLAQIKEEGSVGDQFDRSAHTADPSEQQVEVNEEAVIETRFDQNAHKAGPPKQQARVKDLDEDSIGTIDELDSPENRAMTVLRFLDGAIMADDVGPHYMVYGDLTAYLNHSCIPNAIVVTHLSERRPDETRAHHRMVKILVKALRPISENEEITIRYDWALTAERDRRRKELLQRYGFMCQCSPCIHATNDHWMKQAGQGMWGVLKVPRSNNHLQAHFHNASKLFDGFLRAGLNGSHFLQWSSQMGELMGVLLIDPATGAASRDWIRTYLYRQQTLSWCLLWLGDNHIRTIELQKGIASMKASRPEVKAFAGKFDWEFLLQSPAWDIMFLLDSPPAGRLTAEDCIPALEELRAKGAREKKARANKANRARKKSKKGVAASEGATDAGPAEQSAIKDDAAAAESPPNADLVCEFTEPTDLPPQLDPMAQHLTNVADSRPEPDRVRESTEPVDRFCASHPTTGALANITDARTEIDEVAESPKSVHLPPQTDLDTENLAELANLRIEAAEIVETTKPITLPSETDQTAEDQAELTDSRIETDEVAESTSSSGGVATPDDNLMHPGGLEVVEGELDTWPKSTLETQEQHQMEQPKQLQEAS